MAEAGNATHHEGGAWQAGDPSTKVALSPRSQVIPLARSGPNFQRSQKSSLDLRAYGEFKEPAVTSEKSLCLHGSSFERCLLQQSMERRREGRGEREEDSNGHSVTSVGRRLGSLGLQSCDQALPFAEGLPPGKMAEFKKGET